MTLLLNFHPAILTFQSTFYAQLHMGSLKLFHYKNTLGLSLAGPAWDCSSS